MDNKNKDSGLGVLSAAGIIFIWKWILGNIISMINIGFKQNIHPDFVSTTQGFILFQMIPILLIALILYKQFNLSKIFNTYYFAALILIIICELFLSFYI